MVCINLFLRILLLIYSLYIALQSINLFGFHRKKEISDSVYTFKQTNKNVIDLVICTCYTVLHLHLTHIQGQTIVVALSPDDQSTSKEGGFAKGEKNPQVELKTFNKTTKITPNTKLYSAWQVHGSLTGKQSSGEGRGAQATTEALLPSVNFPVCGLGFTGHPARASCPG